MRGVQASEWAVATLTWLLHDLEGMLHAQATLSEFAAFPPVNNSMWMDEASNCDLLVDRGPILNGRVLLLA